MNQQRQLLDVLTSLEQRLLQAKVRANACALDQLIDDTFIEFGVSGHAFRKPEILCRTPSLPPLEFEPENFKLTELIPGLAQLSFHLRTVNPASGEVSYTLRSSIWKRFGQRWKVVFQQGMPAVEL
ncbi:MAG: nuclear transport factor 2 family protein [Pseudomonadota bacterium]